MKHCLRKENKNVDHIKDLIHLYYMQSKLLHILKYLINPKRFLISIK